MPISITSETDRLNLSEVGENFINDCCFGEDISNWIVGKLNSMGFSAEVICMEDFGWANRVECSGESYLMCISGEASDDRRLNFGTWRIILVKERSFIQEVLRKNKMNAEEPIFGIIQNLLSSEGFENIHIEL